MQSVQHANMCTSNVFVLLWPVTTMPSFCSRRGSFHGASFHIKRNTFVVVRLSFYMTAVCWHPWNCKLRVQECNLLKQQPSFQQCKLASGVHVNAVTTLMLMLGQVNALHSSHYQTLIKLWLNSSQCTESWSNMTTSIEANFSVPRIILEVKLRLNFFFCGCLGLRSNRKLTSAAPMVCHYKLTLPTTGQARILQRFQFM